jgi:hypothetical protein
MGTIAPTGHADGSILQIRSVLGGRSVKKNIK